MKQVSDVIEALKSGKILTDITGRKWRYLDNKPQRYIDEEWVDSQYAFYYAVRLATFYIDESVDD